MKRLRHSLASRVGATIASLALCLQLALASWGAPMPPPDAGDLLPHALCLAAGTDTPAPAKPAPAAPAHDHSTFCCLWHAPPALGPDPLLAGAPVRYHEPAFARTSVAAFRPADRHQPASARAPPTIA